MPLKMLQKCRFVISSRMKRWLSAIVGVQCLLLVVYLVFTHNPTEKEKQLKEHVSRSGNLWNHTHKSLLHKASPQKQKSKEIIDIDAKLKAERIRGFPNVQMTNSIKQKQSPNWIDRETPPNTSNSIVKTHKIHIVARNPSVLQKNGDNQSGNSQFVKRPGDVHRVSGQKEEQGTLHSVNQSVFTLPRSDSDHKVQHSAMKQNDLSTSIPHDLPIRSHTWGAPWPPRGMIMDKLYSKLRGQHSRQFSNYDLSNPPFFYLLNDTLTQYVFHASHNATCMSYGSVKRSSVSSCVCKDGWTGIHCSMPANVAESFSFKYSYSKPEFIGPPNPPRRIINALSFNIEWDLLETRMNELGLVVDLFVIIESNYSMYGEPKPLRLLERLKKGYLKEFHHKIMYVFLDHFPQGGREDGWIAERYQRNFMAKESMQRLKGSLPNDLFMYTDADEIPTFESLLFLKLHTGYSQPVGFYLGWSVYGFYWKNNEPTHVIAACTMKFLRDVLQGDIQALRTTEYVVKYAEAVGWYKNNMTRSRKDHISGVNEWYIGDTGVWAGWHCSWCLPIKDMKIKLTSAINADFPRWGDYPSKLELPYIKHLIQTGTWFDDESKIDNYVEFKNDTSYAPTYLLTHHKKYLRILDLRAIT